MNIPGVPSLVVFDLSVTQNSPAGSCVLAELSGLRREYNITVFSDQCDLGEGINWIRVPLPARPVFLRYWVFQILAFVRYRAWRLSNPTPHLIQSTQGQFLWPDVCYAHFCHRAYLQNQWKRSVSQGLRRAARWVNHVYNGFVERRAFDRAKRIVVPSHGLAKEIGLMYPAIAEKIEVIANPVDAQKLSCPPEFERVSVRNSLGFKGQHRVFSFLALGDFARKGLDVVIEAVSLLPEVHRSRTRVLVIGGHAAEIQEYHMKISRAGHPEYFQFVGFQKDPRPYLWVSDVFVFPSMYETFSLAIHEAAAAGLPVIASRGLYGTEDFVIEGRNGWIVTPAAQNVCKAMQSAIELGDELSKMALNARRSVENCGVEEFVSRWRDLYSHLINSHATH